MTFDIDWRAPRPGQSGFDADWRRTEIVALENRPALVEVERALAASHVNGGARVAQFRFVHADDAVSWAMSRNRFGEFDFFTYFFAHPVVLGAVPEAARPDDPSDAFGPEEAFTSFGRLGGCLAGGGAYQRFAGTDEAVWALTTRFMHEAVGFRVSDCFAWVSWKPWSRWLRGVAWDASFFWFDPREGRATLLLVTDTD